jgi:ADP-ribosyl-[dinitrogen reductase] hydrolase
MTFLPGKKGRGLSGEVYDRDLGRDVRWLRRAHAVDAFVLLVEDHELATLGAADIAHVMTDAGVDLIRHPIQDTRVPTDRAALVRTLDAVRDRLAAGESVVIACRGGLGRTGTVVGCLLRDAGLDAEAAITLTRASRGHTIETSDQERFVASWGAP